MIWSLDENDLRRIWQDVTPDTGLTLRQAMLFYDEEDLAERFYELEAQGYGGDPPLRVGLDGWPTPREVLIDFDGRARELRQAKSRLEFCLLQKLITGRLVATGHAATDALDEPTRTIAADRWRTLVPDIERSSATGPGLVVGGILVFRTRPKPDAAGAASRQVARSKLRAWYVRWVQSNLADGKQPSREVELAAAREHFGMSVSRERLRELRRELAPEEWRRLGRRKNSG
jgi:hypothetical protein